MEPLKLDKMLKAVGHARTHVMNALHQKDIDLTETQRENANDLLSVFNCAEAILTEFNRGFPLSSVSQVFVGVASLMVKDPDMCVEWCEGAVNSLTKFMLLMQLESIRDEFFPEGDKDGMDDRTRH